MFGFRKLAAKAKPVAPAAPQQAPSESASFEWDMWHTTEVTNALIAQLAQTNSFIGAIDHLGYQTDITAEGVQVAKNIPKLAGGCIAENVAIMSFATADSFRLASVCVPPVLRRFAGDAANLQFVEGSKDNLFRTTFPIGDTHDMLVEAKDADVDPAFSGGSIRGAQLMLHVVKSAPRQ